MRSPEQKVSLKTLADKQVSRYLILGLTILSLLAKDFLFLAPAMAGSSIHVDDRATVSIGRFGVEQAQATAASPPAACGQQSLENRHPYAGVYPIWDWWITPEEVESKYPFLRGRQAFVKWSELKPTEGGPYQWEVLDNRVRERLGSLRDKVVYVQVGAFWPDWIYQHVAQAKFTERGVHPPQFWDPVYISLYEQFIRDLAQHIGQADYRDRVVFIRAQYNAFNPESITPWDHFSHLDYAPTPSGHRYPVDFTTEIGNDYATQIVRTYVEAFHPLGIDVVTKPFGSTMEDVQLAEVFTEMGAGFFLTNSVPNPIARHELHRYSRVEARVRSHTEPIDSSEIRDNALQWIYWQTLSDLHQGAEFISYYGADITNDNYIDIFRFADRYAGWYREPGRSPGAWIAFRAVQNPLQHMWGGGFLEGNYEFLIRQIEPNNSKGLFAYQGTGAMDETNLNPESKPVTYLGPKSQKEGIWARQTNGQPIYLDVDDTFAGSLTGEVAVRISYFDSGNDEFQLIFNDGAGQRQVQSYRKGNTQLWQEVTVTLSSYQFANGLENNADLLLHNAGDGDDIFHMVEITRIGVAAQGKLTQGEYLVFFPLIARRVCP